MGFTCIARLCARFLFLFFLTLFLVGETLLRAMIRLSGEVCRTTREGDCLILGNFTGDSDFERGRWRGKNWEIMLLYFWSNTFMSSASYPIAKNLSLIPASPIFQTALEDAIVSRRLHARESVCLFCPHAPMVCRIVNSHWCAPTFWVVIITVV